MLIGAGVNARVIETFREAFPQAEAFHMSGKKEVESGMVFRRKGVPMGAPGLDEWHIPVTDRDEIRQAKEALYRATPHNCVCALRRIFSANSAV